MEQLRYLREQSSTSSLTLQVVPYGVGGHAAPTGFSILRFADPDLPDVVYVENLTSAMERLSIVANQPQQTPQLLDDIIRELEAVRDE